MANRANNLNTNKMLAEQGYLQSKSSQKRAGLDAPTYTTEQVTRTRVQPLKN